MQLFYRQLILSALLFSLIGCGFHLRGILNPDSLQWLNNVAIIIKQAHKDIEPFLKEQLNAYHVQVVTEPTHSKLWLIIDHETLQQNISSISSSTTPRQYQLNYSITFSLQRSDGTEIIPPKKIVLFRQITLNSNRILGSKDEEAIETREMRRDATFQILNRLSRFSTIQALNTTQRTKN